MSVSKEAYIRSTKNLGTIEASVSGLVGINALATSVSHVSKILRVAHPETISPMKTVIEQYVGDRDLFVSSLIVSVLSVFFFSDGLRRISQAETIYENNRHSQIDQRK